MATPDDLMIESLNNINSPTLGSENLNLFSDNPNIISPMQANSSVPSNDNRAIGIVDGEKVAAAMQTGDLSSLNQAEYDALNLSTEELSRIYRNAGEMTNAIQMGRYNYLNDVNSESSNILGDFGISQVQGFTNGIGGMAQLVATGVDLATGNNTNTKLGIAKLFNSINEGLDYLKSDASKRHDRAAALRNQVRDEVNQMKYEEDLAKGDSKISAMATRFFRGIEGGFEDLMVDPSRLGTVAGNAMGSIGSAVVGGGIVSKTAGAVLGRVGNVLGKLNGQVVNANGYTALGETLATAGTNAGSNSVAINALMEGGSAINEVINEISNMSTEDLYGLGGEDFKDLVKAHMSEGMNQEDAESVAKSDLINKASLIAGAIAAPTGGLAGKLVPWETKAFRFNDIVNDFVKGTNKLTAREIAKNAVKMPFAESAEEGIQGITGSLGQNIALQQTVNPNQDLAEGVGPNVAEGMIGAFPATAPTMAGTLHNAFKRKVMEVDKESKQGTANTSMDSLQSRYSDFASSLGSTNTTEERTKETTVPEAKRTLHDSLFINKEEAERTGLEEGTSKLEALSTLSNNFNKAESDEDKVRSALSIIRMSSMLSEADKAFKAKDNKKLIDSFGSEEAFEAAKKTYSDIRQDLDNNKEFKETLQKVSDIVTKNQRNENKEISRQALVATSIVNPNQLDSEQTDKILKEDDSEHFLDKRERLILQVINNSNKAVAKASGNTSPVNAENGIDKVANHVFTDPIELHGDDRKFSIFAYRRDLAKAVYDRDYEQFRYLKDKLNNFVISHQNKVQALNKSKALFEKQRPNKNGKRGAVKVPYWSYDPVKEEFFNQTNEFYTPKIFEQVQKEASAIEAFNNELNAFGNAFDIKLSKDSERVRAQVLSTKFFTKEELNKIRGNTKNQDEYTKKVQSEFMKKYNLDAPTAFLATKANALFLNRNGAYTQEQALDSVLNKYGINPNLDTSNAQVNESEDINPDIPMDGSVPNFTYTSTNNSSLASVDSNGNITINYAEDGTPKADTVDKLVDYISGSDTNNPTSRQKAMVFDQLARDTNPITKETLRDLLEGKSSEETKNNIEAFLAFHEKSHLRHNDRAHYYYNKDGSRNNDLLAQDKIDIGARAVREAVEEFRLYKKNQQSPSEVLSESRNTVTSKAGKTVKSYLKKLFNQKKDIYVSSSMLAESLQVNPNDSETCNDATYDYVANNLDITKPGTLLSNIASCINMPQLAQHMLDDYLYTRKAEEIVLDKSGRVVSAKGSVIDRTKPKTYSVVDTAPDGSKINKKVDFITLINEYNGITSYVNKKGEVVSSYPWQSRNFNETKVNSAAANMGSIILFNFDNEVTKDNIYNSISAVTPEMDAMAQALTINLAGFKNRLSKKVDLEDLCEELDVTEDVLLSSPDLQRLLEDYGETINSKSLVEAVTHDFLDILGYSPNGSVPIDAYTNAVGGAVISTLASLEESGLIQTHTYQLGDKTYYRVGMGKPTNGKNQIVDTTLVQLEELENSPDIDPNGFSYLLPELDRQNFVLSKTNELPQGKFPSNNTKTLLHTDIPLTKEQKEFVENNSKIGFKINPFVYKLVSSLGLDGAITLMGEEITEEDETFGNINILYSKRGKNIEITSSFHAMEKTVASIKHFSEQNKIPMEQVSKHYAYGLTSSGRLQELESHGPIASKLNREIVMSTPSTVDLTNSFERQQLAIALAQAFGVKTNDADRQFIDHLIFGKKLDGSPQSSLVYRRIMRNKELKSIFKKLQNWAVNTENVSVEDFGTNPQDLPITASELKKLIKSIDIGGVGQSKAGDLTWNAVNGIITYARAMSALQEMRSPKTKPTRAKNFSYFNSIESDGTTNGIVNQLNALSTSVTPEQLELLNKGGYYYGIHTGSMNNYRGHNLTTGGKDIYETGANGITVNHTEYCDTINNSKKLKEIFGVIPRAISSLLYFGGLIKSIPENNEVKFERSFAKELYKPITYRAGQASTSMKIIHNIENGLNEIHHEARKQLFREVKNSTPDTYGSFIKYNQDTNKLEVIKGNQDYVLNNLTAASVYWTKLSKSDPNITIWDIISNSNTLNEANTYVSDLVNSVNILSGIKVPNKDNLKTIGTMPESLKRLPYRTMSETVIPTSRTYAGIGSRNTPIEIQQYMQSVASALEDEGLTLRSGGAEGADRAFENGIKIGTHKNIFRPEDISSNKYGNSSKALSITGEIHPNPRALANKGEKAVNLMARNSYQVLGSDLKTPTDFILCYAPLDDKGKPTGGTAQAIRIADRLGIPVFNLAVNGGREQFEDFMKYYLDNLHELNAGNKAKPINAQRAVPANYVNPIKGLQIKDIINVNFSSVSLQRVISSNGFNKGNLTWDSFVKSMKNSIGSSAYKGCTDVFRQYTDNAIDTMLFTDKLSKAMYKAVLIDFFKNKDPRTITYKDQKDFTAYCQEIGIKPYFSANGVTFGKREFDNKFGLTGSREKPMIKAGNFVYSYSSPIPSNNGIADIPLSIISNGDALMMLKFLQDPDSDYYSRNTFDGLDTRPTKTYAQSPIINKAAYTAISKHSPINAFVKVMGDMNKFKNKFIELVITNPEIQEEVFKDIFDYLSVNTAGVVPIEIAEYVANMHRADPNVKYFTPDNVNDFIPLNPSQVSEAEYNRAKNIFIKNIFDHIFSDLDNKLNYNQELIQTIQAVRDSFGGTVDHMASGQHGYELSTKAKYAITPQALDENGRTNTEDVSSYQLITTPEQLQAANQEMADIINAALAPIHKKYENTQNNTKAVQPTSEPEYKDYTYLQIVKQNVRELVNKTKNDPELGPIVKAMMFYNYIDPENIHIVNNAYAPTSYYDVVDNKVIISKEKGKDVDTSELAHELLHAGSSRTTYDYYTTKNSFNLLTKNQQVILSNTYGRIDQLIRLANTTDIGRTFINSLLNMSEMRKLLNIAPDEDIPADALESILGSETVAHAKLTNEFISYVMTERYADGTLFGKALSDAIRDKQAIKSLAEATNKEIKFLARIKEHLVKLIKSFVTALTGSTETKLADSYIATLAANANIVMEIQSRTNQEYLEASSRRLVVNDYYDNNVNISEEELNILNSFNDFVGKLDANEEFLKYAQAKGKFGKATKTVNDISRLADSFVNNGWVFTDSSKTIFQYILGTLNASDGSFFKANDPIKLSYVNQLAEYVSAHITETDLEPDFDSLSDIDKSLVQQKISFLRDIASNQQFDPAHIFLAFAITNPELKEVLSKMKLPQRILKKDHTLDSYLNNLGNSFTDWLGNLYTGADKNKSVYSNLASIYATINEQNRVHSEILDQIGSLDRKAMGFISRMNGIVTSFMDKTADYLVDKDFKGSNLIAGIISKKYGNATAEGILETINALQAPNVIQDLAHDFIGRTKETGDFYKNNKKAKANVQKVREYYANNIPLEIKSTFEHDYSDAEWNSLTKSVLKTDLQSISSMVPSLNSREDIKTEIVRAENKLRTLVEPKVLSLYVSKAKQLANYMNTGIAGSNLLRNAYSISRLFGENIGTQPLNDEVITTIDTMVTLMALDGLSDADLNTLIKIKNQDSKGIDTILKIAKNLDETNKNKLNNNTSYNYQKGYVHPIASSGEHIIVASDTNMGELLQQGYTRVGTYKGSNISSLGSMGYYYSPINAQSMYNEGALQVIKPKAYGLDQRTSVSTNPKAGIEFRKPVISKMATKLRSEKSDTNEFSIPIYNPDGSLSGVEYSVNPEIYKDIPYDMDVTNILGSAYGRNLEELVAQEMNKETVKSLAEMAKGKATSSTFVDISKPNEIKDPVLKDAISVIPKELIDYGKSLMDGAFWVRKDLLNDALGFHMASVRDPWTGVSRWSPETLKGMKTAAIIVFGNGAMNYLVRGEDFMQNITTSAKQTIVVRSIIVPVGNFLGNVVQLMSKNIPITTILSKLPRIVYQLEAYNNILRREVKIQTKLLAAQTETERQKYESMLGLLQKRKEALKDIYPLIKEGELSTIEDVGTMHSEFNLFSGKWADAVETLVDKLPNGVKNVGRYGLITKDTPLYQFLQKSVQYGDFIAKAIYYQDLIEKGTQHSEAIDIIADEFVDYDRSQGRNRGYLESMGLLWFWNFKLRIVKAAYRMIRDNPIQALLYAFINPGIDSPLKDNFFSKLFGGLLPYSIGFGQGLRAPLLNPYVNVMF